MKENGDVRDNILFWLDSDLSHFCIAKFLKEQYDCNLFTIIDFVEPGKKFFQDQKLVKFEKMWFIRDYVSMPTKKIDMDYLISFEKKYKINLWNLAYSERAFHKYNPYYRFNSDEILSILEQDGKFFESILDEIKPDFIIMRMTDDHQTQLLHEICKARGIKILTWNGTRFGYRVMISETSDIPDKPFVASGKYVGKMKSFDELLVYIKKYPEQLQKFSSKFKFSSWVRFKSAIKFMLFIYDKNYKNYFRNLGRTRLKIILHESSLSIKKSYKEYFMNLNSLQNLDKHQPFVYFPIHFEPERAISIPAPYYTNQLEVITHIAKSLPAEYLLYVKEHPMQYLSGWKSISFYKKILELPNVRLLHTSIPTEEILKNCSLVIVIAGTTGSEAGFYNKPVITLADAIYSNLSHIHRLKNLEEFPLAIRASLQKKVDLIELNEYVDFIMKNSVLFDELGMLTAINTKFYMGGFLAHNIDVLEMQLFLEEYKHQFDELIQLYIKKITEYKKELKIN